MVQWRGSEVVSTADSLADGLVEQERLADVFDFGNCAPQVERFR